MGAGGLANRRCLGFAVVSWNMAQFREVVRNLQEGDLHRLGHSAQVSTPPGLRPGQFRDNDRGAA